MKYQVTSKHFTRHHYLLFLSFTLPPPGLRAHLPYKWQHYAPSTALSPPLLIVVKGGDGELRFSFQYFKHLSFAVVCGSRGWWRVGNGRERVVGPVFLVGSRIRAWRLCHLPTFIRYNSRIYIISTRRFWLYNLMRKPSTHPRAHPPPSSRLERVAR